MNTRMTIGTVWRMGLAMLVAVTTATAEAPALLHAHAHNDYEHEHPLTDALSQGFTSVEADIHLQEGELLVAHSRAQIKPDRTLRKLYLEPLRQLVRANHGRVHPERAGFYLLIDYKGDDRFGGGEAIHLKLREQLTEYADVLTRFDGTNVQTKAITVVLTGARPMQTVKGESTRYWSIDGQLPELSPVESPALVPWISFDWPDHFKWKARAPIPAEEDAKLADMVTKAHAAGRLIRFYGAPDNPRFWECSRTHGVDLVNTDKLKEFAQWCAEHPELNK